MSGKNKKRRRKISSAYLPDVCFKVWYHRLTSIGIAPSFGVLVLSVLKPTLSTLCVFRGYVSGKKILFTLTT